MQMTRNQPQTFQNRRIFRELNNVTLAELPSKLRQTLILSCSLRVESLHTSFAVAVGLQSQLALVTITTKFYPQRVKCGGAQIER